MLDRFECYELCVQSPRHLVAFMDALHPGAVVLREDFCGTAAVSRRWLADAHRRGEKRRAIAVDNDPEIINRIRAFSAEPGGSGLEARLADALAEPDTDADRADAAGLIFVGNFSIGYIHQRQMLVTYLRACARRLRAGVGGFGGGWLLCDTYGGVSAYRLGGFERRHPSRGREIIRYAWTHDAADPLTSMVENSISFRIELDGDIIAELPRAFVYRWRLWSIFELREAMTEAGFASTHVFENTNVAPGQAPAEVTDPAELGEDWIVLVAGRV
ncbi:MAG: hypothetical protein IT435_11420 [Phycisphaerales bacterium]|nr:hypothetical protein [Phycisphaerales bacterium]